MRLSLNKMSCYHTSFVVFHPLTTFEVKTGTIFEIFSNSYPKFQKLREIIKFAKKKPR